MVIVVYFVVALCFVAWVIYGELLFCLLDVVGLVIYWFLIGVVWFVIVLSWLLIWFLCLLFVFDVHCCLFWLFRWVDWFAMTIILLVIWLSVFLFVCFYCWLMWVIIGVFLWFVDLLEPLIVIIVLGFGLIFLNVLLVICCLCFSFLEFGVFGFDCALYRLCLLALDVFVFVIACLSDLDLALRLVDELVGLVY